MFDLSPGLIFFSIVFSFVGIGYCSYGKKSGSIYFQLAGFSLIIVTIFVNSMWWLIILGTGLAILPFLFERL